MNALEINNLSKSFTDFKLDNLNLTLPSGCILGPVLSAVFLLVGVLMYFVSWSLAVRLFEKREL